MMNSMTGFGRAEDKDKNRQCVIEIRSVNSRFRDISFRLPSTLNVLEPKLRDAIQDRLTRGKIDVFVTLNDFDGEGQKVELNQRLAQEYLNALKQLCHLDTWVEPTIDLRLVAEFPGVVTLQEESVDAQRLWEMVEPVFLDALEQLCQARQAEGEKMREDIVCHADKSRRFVGAIKALAPTAYEESTGKLRDRIQSALKEVPVDEMRFLNEVAILSDKLAIDEELARLETHLDRLYELLDQNEPVGRKIDFLLQELNREANTIGSKTDNVEITNLVVELKSEIEKIREQVQNIE